MNANKKTFFEKVNTFLSNLGFLIALSALVCSIFIVYLDTKANILPEIKNPILLHHDNDKVFVGFNIKIKNNGQFDAEKITVKLTRVSNAIASELINWGSTRISENLFLTRMSSFETYYFIDLGGDDAKPIIESLLSSGQASFPLELEVRFSSRSIKTFFSKKEYVSTSKYDAYVVTVLKSNQCSILPKGSNTVIIDAGGMTMVKLIIAFSIISITTLCLIFWMRSKFVIDGSSESAENQDASLRNDEYNRLTTHLSYLDNKILEFLKLYIQIATAIVGGSFYLSSKKTVVPSEWIILSSGLMTMMSVGTILFIQHHLIAWMRFRKVLAREFPFTKTPTGWWYASEMVACIFICIACIIFWFFNPLLK